MATEQSGAVAKTVRQVSSATPQQQPSAAGRRGDTIPDLLAQRTRDVPREGVFALRGLDLVEATSGVVGKQPTRQW